MKNKPAGQPWSREPGKGALSVPAQFLPSSALAWRTPIVILNAINMEPSHKVDEITRRSNEWDMETVVFQKQEDLVDS